MIYLNKCLGTETEIDDIKNRLFRILMEEW